MKEASATRPQIWTRALRRLRIFGQRDKLRLTGPKRGMISGRKGKRYPGHKVYPYLLRGKTIDRANQVWAADITYIPMRQGFLYLIAISGAPQPAVSPA
jgi:hypothetical protein